MISKLLKYSSSNTSQLQHILIGCLVERDKVSNVSYVFRPLDLIFVSNEVHSLDNIKIVLTTQLLTDYSVIKAYRSLVKCKCKLRGLFAANQGGGLLYIRGYGSASSTFKPLPFADQTFGKILNPLQTDGENIRKYVL